jgi:hypothetical protein
MKYYFCRGKKITRHVHPCLRLLAGGIALLAPVMFLALPLHADDLLRLDQWRVCAVSDSDFQKRIIPAKPDWVFVGHPANSYKSEKMFAHAGRFAFYVHFHIDHLPDTAQPLLLLNGLPEGSVVLLAGKPLTQINQKRKGSDEFSVERWYQIPAGALKSGTGDRNRFEIWSPAVRKSKDEMLAPLSQIVYVNPDILAERERKRKLMYPYLHDVEDTEDPYVARHW